MSDEVPDWQDPGTERFTIPMDRLPRGVQLATEAGRKTIPQPAPMRKRRWWHRRHRSR